jgi:hypothetical protein
MVHATCANAHAIKKGRRLSATVHVANSAQNFPKLPKDETLKFHQKIENVSYAIFIVKKWPLYVNFSIPPCGN